ncbi:hypothetical protein K9N68_27405 [Kovacikia minuta CCNUW1]|uniref:hypothetical protein n=1 Tax=Kovacikia minuta TaxID=2931930 RepID=UPI001CCFB3EC|nr:hypothetical protein [Kovacikia minuta]UBF25301.1 hypothetical protein K9N68_27405 [Kovacikia minuta CCNUW1]
MSIKQSHYEELLAEYSNAAAAIALLKQYRPYLELLPSMRRPDQSIITIPLPVVNLRHTSPSAQAGVTTSVREAHCLPCDLAMLMCDPEWKIKTGVEVFVFIHRPEEDFSDLLRRWRQTQVLLSKGYEWEMPLRYRHILNEGADNLYPLFVVFEGTPERIKRGLKGAYLPFVTQSLEINEESQTEPNLDEVVLTENREENL